MEEQQSPSQRVSARWLLRYLEAREQATIDDAALVMSCLVALGGDRHLEAVAAVRVVPGRLTRNRNATRYVPLQMDEPSMAFAVHHHDPPAIEVRVNFGLFAGRDATAAEIDRLAAWLLDEVGEVSIISEERHEIDSNIDASVHQVRIEVASDRVPGEGPEREELERRILERAKHWVRLCVAERHTDGAEA
jgi:hypothetical protein